MPYKHERFEHWLKQNDISKVHLAELLEITRPTLDKRIYEGCWTLKDLNVLKTLMNEKQMSFIFFE